MKKFGNIQKIFLLSCFFSLLNVITFSKNDFKKQQGSISYFKHSKALPFDGSNSFSLYKFIPEINRIEKSKTGYIAYSNSPLTYEDIDNYYLNKKHPKSRKNKEVKIKKIKLQKIRYSNYFDLSSLEKPHYPSKIESRSFYFYDLKHIALKHFFNTLLIFMIFFVTYSSYQSITNYKGESNN